LLENLPEIPIALVSQFFPRQYSRIMDGMLGRSCLDIVLDRVGDWCADYAAACGVTL
jgi:tagatose-1,6-bisphosphate aldolase non-catalytic subunit AgaZ/GatZ